MRAHATRRLECTFKIEVHAVSRGQMAARHVSADRALGHSCARACMTQIVYGLLTAAHADLPNRRNLWRQNMHPQHNVRRLQVPGNQTS